MSAMNPTHLQQFSLSGKLAIVTGGARGLGLEMVRGLAAAGATVYLHGRDLTQMTDAIRSEEHTSELQSLMRISYAVFCLKKKLFLFFFSFSFFTIFLSLFFFFLFSFFSFFFFF